MIRLSRSQIGIIRRIAKKQEASFISIASTADVMDIYESLRDMGYDISITEVLDRITTFILMWEEVKENPEKFTQILDDLNMGMVRDYLINEHGHDNFINPVLKGIHRRINLFESVKRDNLN